MNYFRSLDGVRALAVSVVLLAHAGVPGVRSGGAGVDIFFTLSGFLITSILLAELDQFRSISFLNFYARRFLRLLPCLGMVLAAVLAIWALRGHLDDVLREVVFSATYSMNWFRACGGVGGGPLDHTWTLAIEEQFYLIWPFVIGLACRNANRRTAQGCCLLAASLTVVVYRVSVSTVFSKERIHYGLDTHADPLLMGSALACLLSGEQIKLNGLFSRLFSYVLVPAALLAIGFIVTNWSWGTGGLVLTIGYPLVGLATVILLLDCVAGKQSLVRPILEWSALVWIGRISYGIYLWHLPIFLVLRSQGLDGWKSLLFLGGGLTLAVSALSYYLVERQCLRLKSFFTRGRHRVRTIDSHATMAILSIGLGRGRFERLDHPAAEEVHPVSNNSTG